MQLNVRPVRRHLTSQTPERSLYAELVSSDERPTVSPYNDAEYVLPAYLMAQYGKHDENGDEHEETDDDFLEFLAAAARHSAAPTQQAASDEVPSSPLRGGYSYLLGIDLSDSSPQPPPPTPSPPEAPRPTRRFNSASLRQRTVPVDVQEVMCRETLRYDEALAFAAVRRQYMYDYMCASDMRDRRVAAEINDQAIAAQKRVATGTISVSVGTAELDAVGCGTRWSAETENCPQDAELVDDALRDACHSSVAAVTLDDPATVAFHVEALVPLPHFALHELEVQQVAARRCVASPAAGTDDEIVATKVTRRKKREKKQKHIEEEASAGQVALNKGTRSTTEALYSSTPASGFEPPTTETERSREESSVLFETSKTGGIAVEESGTEVVQAQRVPSIERRHLLESADARSAEDPAPFLPAASPQAAEKVPRRVETHVISVEHSDVISSAKAVGSLTVVEGLAEEEALLTTTLNDILYRQSVRERQLRNEEALSAELCAIPFQRPNSAEARRDVFFKSVALLTSFESLARRDASREEDVQRDVLVHQAHIEERLVAKRVANRLIRTAARCVSPLSVMDPMVQLYLDYHVAQLHCEKDEEKDRATIALQEHVTFTKAIAEPVVALLQSAVYLVRLGRADQSRSVIEGKVRQRRSQSPLPDAFSSPQVDMTRYLETSAELRRYCNVTSLFREETEQRLQLEEQCVMSGQRLEQQHWMRIPPGESKYNFSRGVFTNPRPKWSAGVRGSLLSQPCATPMLATPSRGHMPFTPLSPNPPTPYFQRPPTREAHSSRLPSVLFDYNSSGRCTSMRPLSLRSETPAALSAFLPAVPSSATGARFGPPSAMRRLPPSVATPHSSEMVLKVVQLEISCRDELCEQWRRSYPKVTNALVQRQRSCAADPLLPTLVDAASCSGIPSSIPDGFAARQAAGSTYHPASSRMLAMPSAVGVPHEIVYRTLPAGTLLPTYERGARR